MGLFGSGNPNFKEETFAKAAAQERAQTGTIGEIMTVEGAINKSFMLFGLLLTTSIIGYTMPNAIFFWAGMLGGSGIFIWAQMKKEKSPILAPVFALLEGLFVGTLSAMYAIEFQGIIFQAVSLTFGVLFMMLFIYKAKIIKVTKGFKSAVLMATGAIMLMYLVNLVLYFFGIQMPFLHDSGPIGIGISVVILGIASLNFLLDFDNIEKGAQYNAPKYMEWFCAMSLLFTLVWVYIEILRLLGKLRR